LQETRTLPELAPNEVQVSVRATGLCGSDLHYYNHGRNGNFKLRSPLVLGHEASGVVTAVPSVKTNGRASSDQAAPTPEPSLKVGDRVALEVGLPCHVCHLCSIGRYNLCPKLSFKSSAKTFPHTDGTLQTTITHPAAMCHRLPESVTFEQGALVEPLAVSLHAINRSVSAGSGTSGDPLPGSTALVLGAGAVGMLTAVTLSVMGVAGIVIADIDAKRLAIAAGIGGGRYKIKTHLLPRSPPPSNMDEALASAESLAEELNKTFETPVGFSRVFECTGMPPCVQMGIFSTAAGGKLVLIGMGTPVQTLPLGAAALREVDIIGVFRYANCYPAAISLFTAGKLDGVAEALVTHRVPLAEGEKAFRLAANQTREGEDQGKVAVKVVVVS
jgi:L-iditol 2-dehydrogenase